MGVPDQVQTFVESVSSAFAFLSEAPYECTALPPRRSDEGGRDESVAIRYTGAKSDYDIAYALNEKGVGVLVKSNRQDVERRYRHVHLDSVALFLSQGKDLPIVPQVFYGMSAKKIEKVVALRDELFREVGLRGIVERLSARLKMYDEKIAMMTPDDLMDYHAWYEKEAKDMDY
jgi:hypothetical protein